MARRTAEEMQARASCAQGLCFEVSSPASAVRFQLPRLWVLPHFERTWAGSSGPVPAEGAVSTRERRHPGTAAPAAPGHRHMLWCCQACTRARLAKVHQYLLLFLVGFKSGKGWVSRFAATAKSVSVPCSLSPPFPRLRYNVPSPERAWGCTSWWQSTRTCHTYLSHQNN